MTRDITIFIKELLFGHDCVIVPGFGAFIGNYSPARIDHAEGLFYPPVKKITFNRHLINNDGLLIGHISSREGIGYGEARSIAESFTDNLKKRLGNGEKVSIDRIGTFFNNREGILIFEPDPDANYLLSSFGLKSYHRAPVKDFDLRRRVIEREDAEPARPTSMRRMLTRAAVIIPLLVAMALIPFRSDIFNGRVDESNMNPLAVAELEYSRSQIRNVTPSVTDSSELIADAGSQHEPVISVPPAVSPVELAVPVEEGDPGYMIITGSFKLEANALTMIRSLESKGFSPVVTSGPDGFFRVSAGTYGTSKEANEVLKGLRSGYPGAWVCKSE